MLIEFSVGNYRSFKDIVTFSMVASKIKEKEERLNEEPIFAARKNVQLLTSAAIYGANASGKSNLIRAIKCVRNMVTDSSKATQIGDPIDVEPFRLSYETQNKPSHFEIVIIANGIQYRYGFKATRKRIVAEWLYHVANVQETLLFERKYDKFSISQKFKEGKGWQDKTRSNVLFISLVAQFNGALSQIILKSLSNFQIISGLDDTVERVLTSALLSSALLSVEGLKKGVLDFIKNLDLNISDIIVGDFKEGPLINGWPQIKVLHRMANKRDSKPSLVEFDLHEHESEGTKKLVHLSGLLWLVLTSGGTIAIDEMDARLHPIITREIINLFNSTQSNPKHAQLIVVTHDTNLLEQKIFRRDQIWFTEKNREGATDLYSLAEYKSESGKVRNDASWEKDYIRGRYGAIPFIGDLSSIVGGK